MTNQAVTFGSLNEFMVLLENEYQKLSNRLIESIHEYSYSPAIISAVDRQYTLLSQLDKLIHRRLMREGFTLEALEEYPAHLIHVFDDWDKIWEDTIKLIVERMETYGGSRKEAELIVSNQSKRIEQRMQALIDNLKVDFSLEDA